MRTAKSVETDPLFVIFEEHLYNFEDSQSDRKTFICNVIQDYFSYLRKMNITIPKSLEQPIVEELAAQVNTMLVKKIYGCYSISDYQKKVPTPAKRKARTKYKTLSRSSRRAG